MKIIATDIANLTDARYFAAWGVEGLAYTIDSDNALSPEKLKEIVDWVEGPETMIKLEGLEVPDHFSSLQSELSIKRIIVGPFIDVSHLEGCEKVFRICTLEDGWQDSDHLFLSFPQKIDSISEVQKEKLTQLTAEKEVYLDGSFTASDLDLITKLGFEGIILKGGEEEKVGFKSYDELDDILEALFD